MPTLCRRCGYRRSLAGLSALYPVHGIEWEMWGEKYIFRNADEMRDRIISVGPVTDAERDNRANQEIARFLDTHLLEVRERPVQKYELVREGAMWRLEPLVYMGTWKGGRGLEALAGLRVCAWGPTQRYCTVPA